MTIQELRRAKLQPKTTFLAQLVDTEDKALGRVLHEDEAAEEVMAMMQDLMSRLSLELC